MICVFGHRTPPSQNHKTDVSRSAHITHGRRTKTETDREGDSKSEERRLSVSVLQRHCSSLPPSLYSLSVLLLGTLYQSKMIIFDVLGMRLNY